MSTRLTADDAKQSLNAHVAAKGAELFAKYGPRIGWNELQAILQDRTCVRYPCELVFDAAKLDPGELAFPEPRGEKPEVGFTLFVHPYFMMQLDRVPFLALYQLVVVNYGVFASSDDAETFASQSLGLPREEYYRTLCDLADELGVGPDVDEAHGLSDSGGCGGAS